MRRLALAAALLALAVGTSAAKLNQGYLVPSGKVHLDRSVLKSSAGKVCALTFDDGPDSKYTAQIAAILKEHGIKATFFVVGSKLTSYPAVIKELLAGGHELANHTYTHPLSTKLSAAKLKEQLEKTNAALAKFGVTPRWFRPPYGEFNKSIVKTASAAGLETVLWSVDPRDWAEPGTDKIVSRVLNGVAPGAVILLHSTHAQTVAALPRIITGLTERGYSFVTMSQWAQVVSGAGSTLEVAPAPAPNLPGTKSQHPLSAPHELAPPLAAAASASVLVNAASPPVTDPPPAAAATDSEAQPFAPAGEPLRIYSNFLSTRGAAAVWQKHQATELYSFAAQPKAAVADAPVAVADQLPVTAAAPAPATVATPPQSSSDTAALPAPAAAAAAASPTAPAADPSPPTLGSAEGLTVRRIELYGPQATSAEWAPPALDRRTWLNATLSQYHTDTHPLPECYFVSTIYDGRQYDWPALNQFMHLGRLAGFIAAEGYTTAAPASEAHYPTLLAPLDNLNQSACVDLASATLADVLALCNQGQAQICLLLRPSNVALFNAADDWPRLAANLRDFVLWRQLTAGMHCTAAAPPLSAWQLPAAIETAVFTDGTHGVLALWSKTGETLEVPKAIAGFSQATAGEDGTLVAAPLTTARLHVGPSPLLLVWTAAAN